MLIAPVLTVFWTTLILSFYFGPSSHSASGHRIPAPLLAALNAHANKELAASQGYLAMSYFFDDLNFEGIGAYFRSQANEERDHGMKIFAYIIERGDRVAMESLPAPKAEWTNATEALWVHLGKASVGLFLTLISF